MMEFRKNKGLLLKELRELVTKGLEHSEDRRLSRKLRYMRKEVDKWISELKNVEEKDKNAGTSSNKS